MNRNQKAYSGQGRVVATLGKSGDGMAMRRVVSAVQLRRDLVARQKFNFLASPDRRSDE